MKTAAAALILTVALGTVADAQPRVTVRHSPHDDQDPTVHQIQEAIRIAGPRLGVSIDEVDADVAKRLGLKEERGALVTDVVEGSAADKAGLKKDDVIVRFQGDAVHTAGQLTRMVRENPEGRTVSLDIVRAGAPMSLKATLERRSTRLLGPGGESWSGRLSDETRERLHEDMKQLRDNLRGSARSYRFEGGPGAMRFFSPDGDSVWAFSGGRPRLGISYQEIEGQFAEYFKAPAKEAILITNVNDDSPAARAGMKAGDILLKLGGVTVRDSDDLRKAIDEIQEGDGKPATATVLREGRSVDLTVTMEKREARPRRARPTT
jgi:S1-C subfamily serine protease